MKQALRDENMFERLRSCDLSSCLSSLLDPVEEPSYIRSLNTCHTCWHQAALSAGVWIYGSAAGPAHSCCLFSRKTVCAWCKSLMFSIHQCKRTFWGFTCVWQYCWWGGGGGGCGRDDRCQCEGSRQSWHLWPPFRHGLLRPGGPSTG